MRNTVIILLAIGLLAFLAYQATGSRLDGEAATSSDFPIVGSALSELRLLSPAKYRGFEHPHGGGTFTLAGTATSESVDKFCRNAEITLSASGSSQFDRTFVLEQLRHFNTIDKEVVVDEKTLVLVGLGGRFPKLFGTFDSSTQRFLIYLQFEE